MSLLAGTERLQTRIGAIALGVILGAIAFVVFLADRIELTDQVRFRVYFRHTGPLAEGADVIVAGERVGEVESIALVPRGAPGPLGGEPGVVARVRVEADDAWMVDRRGEFFVSSRGPLAERYLEAGPQPCERRARTRPRDCTPASVVPREPIRGGAEVRGIDPPSMDRVLQRTWENLQTTRAFVDSVRPEFDALIARIDELRATLKEVEPAPGEWGRLAREAGGMIDGLRTLYDEMLGGGPGVDRIRATIGEGRAVMALARTRLAELDARWQPLVVALDRMMARLEQKGGAAGKRLAAAIERAQAAFAKLEPLRAKIQDIAGKIERGEGSIGKLSRDPEFPEDAKELGRILKRQPWKIIGHPPDDLDRGGRAP